MQLQPVVEQRMQLMAADQTLAKVRQRQGIGAPQRRIFGQVLTHAVLHQRQFIQGGEQ